MKFGHWCKCGWVLQRRELTRKEYSAKKHDHALGVNQPKPCKFLASELAATCKDEFKRQMLRAVL